VRGVTAVVVGAILVVFFLLLVAVMAWQEATARDAPAPSEYVLRDAASWIRSRLTSEIRLRVSPEDVLAILEWQVYLLQTSVRGVRLGDAEVIVGDTENTVGYICGQLELVQRRQIDAADVAAVLAGQGAYLVSIGAVGEPVAGQAHDVDG